MGVPRHGQPLAGECSTAGPRCTYRLPNDTLSLEESTKAERADKGTEANPSPVELNLFDSLMKTGVSTH